MQVSKAIEVYKNMRGLVTAFSVEDRPVWKVQHSEKSDDYYITSQVRTFLGDGIGFLLSMLDTTLCSQVSIDIGFLTDCEGDILRFKTQQEAEMLVAEIVEKGGQYTSVPQRNSTATGEVVAEHPDE